MKNKLLLLPLLLCLSLALQAHNGSINGQILENGSGYELAGATIRLEPGNLYTHSNALGFFTYNNLQSGNYTLTISYLGYETKTISAVNVRDAETTTLRIDINPAQIDLQDVEIKTSTAQPFQSISTLDIRTRPIASTQEILRIVPGLFIAQHAGGGKAEQIFLRGFDIDHGTDINLTVAPPTRRSTRWWTWLAAGLSSQLWRATPALARVLPRPSSSTAA